MLQIIILDINECATGTPCNGGTCANTPGTFTCDCTGTGFVGATCDDGEKQLMDSSGKHAHAMNTPLNPIFIVKLGYVGVYCTYFSILYKT